jgi:Nitrogen regulatory protein P-II
MKLIMAIIKPHKLEELRDALARLGARGLTVTEAKGYGRQRGTTKFIVVRNTRRTLCQRSGSRSLFPTIRRMRSRRPSWRQPRPDRSATARSSYSALTARSASAPVKWARTPSNSGIQCRPRELFSMGKEMLWSDISVAPEATSKGLTRCLTGVPWFHFRMRVHRQPRTTVEQPKARTAPHRTP